eukprot:gene45076-56110_t
MDASPLFSRFEIPLTGQSHIASDRELTRRLSLAAREFLQNESGSPQFHRGLIASGDQFINKRSQIAALKDALPELLAVEMEGAAVAQACGLRPRRSIGSTPFDCEFPWLQQRACLGAWAKARDRFWVLPSACLEISA